VREALAARSGRDFVMSGPSPLAAAGKQCGRALKGVLLLVLRYPAVLAALLLLGAGFAAVTTNALLGQTARHPAPLFGLKPFEKRVASVAAPLPPSRPAAPAPLPPVAAPAPTPAPVAPTPPAKPAQPRDPIGDLIRAGEAGASVASPETARIAAAQKALTKLGYGPLKADGMAGAGTRQAIERFEKDRRLPVTGELKPKTVKELSAQAGMPVE
jgi:hypothetical protein